MRINHQFFQIVLYLQSSSETEKNRSVSEGETTRLEDNPQNKLHVNPHTISLTIRYFSHLILLHSNSFSAATLYSLTREKRYLIKWCHSSSI